MKSGIVLCLGGIFDLQEGGGGVTQGRDEGRGDVVCTDAVMVGT